MLCQKNLHLASQIRSSSLPYPRRRDRVYAMGAVCAKLVLSAVVCLEDTKSTPSAFYPDLSKCTKRRFEKARLMDT
jgi:hypothetical protein